MEDGQMSAQRIVIAITACLWATTLFAGGGYWYGGGTGALLGAMAGLLLASGLLAALWFAGTGGTQEDDIVRKNRERDWIRLLDHEKCQFARQLEREGDLTRAQDIYEHLVELRYHDPMPYERLAAMHRAHGNREAELNVLERAIEFLSGTSASASRHGATQTLSTFKKRRDALLRTTGGV